MAFELTLGDVAVTRNLLHGFSDDFRRALCAVRRPVLVTAEVEVMRLLLVGQRRQVRDPVTHLAEAAEHGLIVFQRLVVVELVALSWKQLVAIYQTTGRLIHHDQFDAFAFERIVQFFHAAVAGRRGVEFGAQVFLSPEQPVALSLDQCGEVLLITRGVVFRVMRGRAQRAARLGLERRRLRVVCPSDTSGGHQGGGEAGQAQQLDQMCVHNNTLPHSRSSVWLSTGSINTAFF